MVWEISKMQKIRKGVIPAAGLGTRLYPLTKEQPKEMLPVGGRPMIYCALLEALLSGLEQLYVIVNKDKTSLRHYLEGGKLYRDLREDLRARKIGPPQITFVDQPVPLGSGEAVYRTKDMIGDDPFALMMPDFLLIGPHPALGQMIPLYEQYQRDIVGVLTVGAKEAEGFGNVGIFQGTHLEPGLVEVHSFSGKSKHPLILNEGQNILKLAGRWILGPHFFSYLERTRDENRAWDDNPALRLLTQERHAIGKPLEGSGFDVGNPIGYRAAKEQFEAF
jgi:UTP--glucose-1-phosphate uridylyltransferase